LLKNIFRQYLKDISNIAICGDATDLSYNEHLSSLLKQIDDIRKINTFYSSAGKDLIDF